MEQEAQQLIIPNKNLTPEVLEFLRDNQYYKIVPNESFSSQTPIACCFSKMCFASDKHSLETACRSGADVILKPHTAEASEGLETIMASFDYAPSSQSKAVPITEEEVNCQPLPYYTKLFDEKLESVVQSQYREPQRGKRGNKNYPSLTLQDYKVPFDTFVIDEQNMKINPDPTLKGVNVQTVSVHLMLETHGSSSEPSIVMQLSKFGFGVMLRNGFFDHNHMEFLGFFPEVIRITIEQPDSQLNHCLFIPNADLAINNTVRRSPNEFKVQLRVKLPAIAKLGFEKTFKNSEVVESSSVTPVYEGDNRACCIEWKLETWGDGRLYNVDKPMLALEGMLGWPKLPFRGTGPMIGGLPRIRWINVPEDTSKVSFTLRVESQMVLLRKKSFEICGVQVGLGVKCYRKKLEHTAVMQLKKRTT